VSVLGLVQRTAQRLRTDGPRRLGRLIAHRYWDPVAANLLFAGRMREFTVGEEFPLSIPAFNEEELRRIYADLQSLAQTGSIPKSIEVRIGVLTSEKALPPPPSLKSFSIQVVALDTSKLVLGYVLWSGNVYVPEYLCAEPAAELAKTLSRLGVEPLHSLDAIVERIGSRMQLNIKGPARTSRALYRALTDRLGGAHYGYREPLDVGIIAELPGKYEYFAEHCEINFVPIRNLTRYPGRVSRQYAVGEMYRAPYLNGKSVLDVGCDIRGISERVGSSTRYVGVDMQGLADVCIDLDSQRLPFPPRSFETVLCFEVLEHLNKIHQAFDDMLSISDRFFVGSLFVESGIYGGRSVTRFGEALGNMQLPIAPVYDRHEWIFNASDALDFIYYRAKKAGFRIVRLDIFYDDARLIPFQVLRLRRAMRIGNSGFLSKAVQMIGFVVERQS
jgi:hypothetical protein